VWRLLPWEGYFSQSFRDGVAQVAHGCVQRALDEELGMAPLKFVIHLVADLNLNEGSGHQKHGLVSALWPSGQQRFIEWHVGIRHEKLDLAVDVSQRANNLVLPRLIFEVSGRRPRLGEVWEEHGPDLIGSILIL